jgi:hypothetical protein
MDTTNKPVAWLVQYRDRHEFRWKKPEHLYEALACEPLYTHPVKEQRCSTCDGTGDVHSIDGQWLGECPWCSHPVKEQGNPVAWRSQSPDGYWSVYQAPVKGAEPLYTGFRELTDEQILCLWDWWSGEDLATNVLDFADTYRRALLGEAGLVKWHQAYVKKMNEQDPAWKATQE